MGRIHRIRNIQHIPAGIDAVWRFFSDPHQLKAITPPSLSFEVTSPLFGDEVYAGQVITYTVKPLLGIPLSWMTEITHVERNRMFVDEQRKGPYRLWHHQHHFKTVDGGVEMTDLVHYELPFGFVGGAVHPWLVRPKLKEIFNYRFDRIAELFGPWPGDEKRVEME